MPLPINPIQIIGGKLGSQVGLKVTSEKELITTLCGVQSPQSRENFLSYLSEWKSEIPNHNVDLRFYPNLSHGVRSTWEANFGLWVLDKKLTYFYEPVTFPLSDGSKYTPDFRVTRSGVWVEVKGLWVSGAKKKVKLFLRDFPDEKLILVNKELYSKLTKVPGWIK